MNRFVTRALAAAFALLLAPGLACAQAWPTKPVRMMSTFAAGGGTDAFARQLATALKQALGTGAIDVPAIIAASAGNAEWLIVELDDYDGDMFTAVAESAAYMIGNGLAAGRG